MKRKKEKYFKMHIKGRKPTREERKIIEKAKLDTYAWFVQKNTNTELYLLHKETGERKIITK